ncbi:hypothetical protein LOTGIDRAFT_231368 [Lottia gigantea]|uniref:EB domain-containing protein n=1 Tax=Lottia gigantea TaxID=225164 RepID=V4ATN9_LOTGI|nr:hypothetical protein LOTGIDRAFT_231368 [Lottia gigantea]ESO98280.1 hypothetical protein LOTGIDRAFT_231368 [Lottia gigantea]
MVLFSFHICIAITMAITPVFTKNIFDMCSSHSDCPAVSSCKPNSCKGYVCLCDPETGLITFILDARKVVSFVGESCTTAIDCPYLSFCNTNNKCECYATVRATSTNRPHCVLPTSKAVGENCSQTIQCPRFSVCTNSKCVCDKGYRKKTDAEYWSNSLETDECIKNDFSLGTFFFFTKNNTTECNIESFYTSVIKLSQIHALPFHNVKHSLKTTSKDSLGLNWKLPLRHSYRVTFPLFFPDMCGSLTIAIPSALFIPPSSTVESISSIPVSSIDVSTVFQDVVSTIESTSSVSQYTYRIPSAAVETSYDYQQLNSLVEDSSTAVAIDPSTSVPVESSSQSLVAVESTNVATSETTFLDSSSSYITSVADIDTSAMLASIESSVVSSSQILEASGTSSPALTASNMGTTVVVSSVIGTSVIGLTSYPSSSKTMDLNSFQTELPQPVPPSLMNLASSLSHLDNAYTLDLTTKKAEPPLSTASSVVHTTSSLNSLSGRATINPNTNTLDLINMQIETVSLSLLHPASSLNSLSSRASTNILDQITVTTGFSNSADSSLIVHSTSSLSSPPTLASTFQDINLATIKTGIFNLKTPSLLIHPSSSSIASTYPHTNTLDLTVTKSTGPIFVINHSTLSHIAPSKEIIYTSTKSASGTSLQPTVKVLIIVGTLSGLFFLLIVALLVAIFCKCGAFGIRRRRPSYSSESSSLGSSDKLTIPRPFVSVSSPRYLGTWTTRASHNDMPIFYANSAYRTEL